MNFHETVYGKRFFDHQLPKLTNAMEAIATALAQKPTPVQFPLDIPPDYLKDIYHDRLEPDAQPSPSQSQDRAAESAYMQLREQAPQEMWHLVEAYQLAVEERNDLYIDQAFATGYRTAMRLIAAGLITSAEQKECGV